MKKELENMCQSGGKHLLIDEGKPVEKRNCPIEKVGECLKCKPFCNITSGFSVAGAFSDGKLSLLMKKRMTYM